MKQMPWRLLAVGAITYLVVLIALFPAGHAVGLIAPRLAPAGLSLAAHGITGTVWSGSAETVSVNGTYAGQVEWRLRLLSLITGRVGIDWQARLGDEGHAAGRSRIAPDGTMTIQGLEATVTAEAAYARFPYLPVVPTGELTLSLSELRIEQGRPTGATGQVAWSEAGLSAPQPLRFGELRLALETSPQGEIIGRFADGGGPLQTEGTVTLSPEGQYRLDLLLTPAPDAENSLKQGLMLVGRPDARGRARLQLNGQI